MPATHVSDVERRVARRVRHAEPAAEVVDGEVAERAERARRRAGTARARTAGSRCACAGRRPASPAGASAISARASSGAKPNFEPAWPVRIASCVSASTPGVTRSSTRCGRPPSSPDSRSRLLGVVEHDRPDAGLERHRQLRARLGVAVQVDAARARSPRAARGAARRPRRRRSPGPPRRTAAARRVQGNALEANTTSPGPSWCAASAPVNARARARRSSSATTYAGVPNSRASASASQPPISRRPSRTSEASGRTWAVAAAMRRAIIALRPAGVRCAWAATASRRPAPDRGG